MLRPRQVQRQWAEYLGLPVKETNSIGMPLVLIPPGELMMGSTSEDIAWALEDGKKNMRIQWYVDRVASEVPRHRVKISKPFYMGMYTVTQGEYERVMGVNPSAFNAKQIGASAVKPPLSEDDVKQRSICAQRVPGKDTSRHPVEMVSWKDAAEFCRRISAMPAERAARRGYRLPTEAEWEYACRAGTTTRWCFGDDVAAVGDYAWFEKNSRSITQPVGKKRPNAWGLCDMQGNVRQWCADWFAPDYYKQSPPNDPAGPPAGSSRSMRGGDWSHPAAICCSRFSRPPCTHRPLHIARFSCGGGIQRGVRNSPSRAGGGAEGEGKLPGATVLAVPVAPLKKGTEAQRDKRTKENPKAQISNPKSEISNPQPPIPNPSLLPVPTDDARDATAKLVQDVYRSDYANAKSPAGKQALAKRILDDALKTRDNTTERYVLLSLAREVAIAGQDEKLAPDGHRGTEANVRRRRLGDESGDARAPGQRLSSGGRTLRAWLSGP